MQFEKSKKIDFLFNKSVKNKIYNGDLNIDKPIIFNKYDNLKKMMGMIFQKIFVLLGLLSLSIIICYLVSAITPNSFYNSEYLYYDEGSLYNSSLYQVEKKEIENYNVKKIISIDKELKGYSFNDFLQD